ATPAAFIPRNDGHVSGVCAMTALPPTMTDNTSHRPRVRMSANVTARPLASVALFFALTYLLSWTFFEAGAAISARAGAGSFALAGLAGVVLLMGVFMPAAVAAGLTFLREGPDGVRALLRQVMEPPVRARWYAFAILFFAAVKLTVALLSRAIAGTWPTFGSEPWYLMAIAI